MGSGPQAVLGILEAADQWLMHSPLLAGLSFADFGFSAGWCLLGGAFLREHDITKSVFILLSF